MKVVRMGEVRLLVVTNRKEWMFRFSTIGELELSGNR